MIAFVLPTRDRPNELAETLWRLGSLGLGPGDAEVIVVDNASRERPAVPGVLANGVRARLICLGRNAGAAARTVGAESSDRDWVVMLDDDSSPTDGGEPLVSVLGRQPADVAAVMADIHLPRAGRRESGGLPEVPIGCGVAYRRGAYMSAGGYDASFGYYAEEYDLSARLLLGGWRVVFERGWRVEHRKAETGRDMDLILGRLVRNNGWVMARYAPDDVRARMIDETIGRYRRIAEKECAVAGYTRGLVELQRTLGDQQRSPMDRATWDRFTGAAAAREAVGEALAGRPCDRAAVVMRGKNAWAVRGALEERGVEITEAMARADDVLVVGTMSPGPMIDAGRMLEPLGRRVVLPWLDARGTVGARA